MPLLVTKVTSVRPHSTYSRMFPFTFSAHRVVSIVTLISSIILLLRVVPLLTLASENTLSFVPPKLLGTLGKVTIMALPG